MNELKYGCSFGKMGFGKSSKNVDFNKDIILTNLDNIRICLSNKATLTKEQLDNINIITEENLKTNGGTLLVPNSINALNDSDIVVMCYYNDSIIGYALLKHLNQHNYEYWERIFGDVYDNNLKDYIEYEKAMYIYQIAVAKAYQNKGIGRTIMGNIIVKCSPVLISNVSVKNEASIRLHQWFNFNIIGECNRALFYGEMNYKSYIFSNTILKNIDVNSK